MKYTKEEINKALREAGISENSTGQFVLWTHVKRGLQVDTLQDYRSFCGSGDAIEDLDFVVPAFDL